MRLGWLSVTVATALCALPASAQQTQPDYGRSGVYAAALGFGAIETFDDSGFDFSDGGGFNIRAGYRVIEHLAAEMQFEYVDGFSDQGIDIDAWNLMWNVKGFPLTGRWQPYALFGLGVIKAEASFLGASSDDADFAIQIGGGLDAYVTESFVLTAELAWVKPTDKLEDLSYLTIGAGIQYRF